MRPLSPVVAGACFVAKIARKVDGDVVVTFADADTMTIRYTHGAETYRRHVALSDILENPAKAALDVLT